MMTRREQIYEILVKGEMTAQQLANYFKAEMWEILEDIKHLAKSVRPKYEMRMTPAVCKRCGFVFKERSKVKKPSKCPRCKEESIQPPLFRIVEKEF